MFPLPRDFFVWRHYMFCWIWKIFAWETVVKNFVLQDVEYCSLFLLRIVCGNYTLKVYFSDGTRVLHWDLQAAWRLLQSRKDHYREGNWSGGSGNSLPLLHSSGRSTGPKVATIKASTRTPLRQNQWHDLCRSMPTSVDLPIHWR